MSIKDGFDRPAQPADQRPSVAKALDHGIDTPLRIRPNSKEAAIASDRAMLMMLAHRSEEIENEEGESRPDGRKSKKKVNALFQLKRRDKGQLTKHAEVLVVIEDLEGNQRVFEATISTQENAEWDQTYNASLVANLEDWADRSGANEVILRTDEPTLRLTLARLGYAPEDPKAFVRSWMDRAGVVIRLVLDPESVGADDAEPDISFGNQVRKYGRGWAKILNRLISEDEYSEDTGDEERIIFNADIERLEVTDDGKALELLGHLTPRYLTDLSFGVGEDSPQMVGAVAVGVADWDGKKELKPAVFDQDTGDLHVPKEWTA